MPSSTPGTGRGRSHSSVGVMPHAFWLLSRNAVPGNVASTVPLRPYHTKPLGPSFSPDENMPVVGTRETELQPRLPSHAQVPVPFATGQATPWTRFPQHSAHLPGILRRTRMSGDKKTVTTHPKLALALSKQTAGKRDNEQSFTSGVKPE